MCFLLHSPFKKKKLISFQICSLIGSGTEKTKFYNKNRSILVLFYKVKTLKSGYLPKGSVKNCFFLQFFIVLAMIQEAMVERIRRASFSYTVVFCTIVQQSNSFIASSKSSLRAKFHLTVIITRNSNDDSVCVGRYVFTIQQQHDSDHTCM